MRAVVVFALLACGEAGVVTGGEITHDGKLSRRQRDLVNYTIATEVCPEVEEQLGEECDVESVPRIMRRLRLDWVEGGDLITYRVKFDPE